MTAPRDHGSPSSSEPMFKVGDRVLFTSRAYGGLLRDGQECVVLCYAEDSFWDVRFDDGEEWISRADELTPLSSKPGAAPPQFDRERDARLRGLLIEFAIGEPSGKQFDEAEMRCLRDDLRAMLSEINRLRAAPRSRGDTPDADAAILSAELVASIRANPARPLATEGDVVALCDSHEALRAASRSVLETHRSEEEANALIDDFDKATMDDEYVPARAALLRALTEGR